MQGKSRRVAIRLGMIAVVVVVGASLAVVDLASGASPETVQIKSANASSSQPSKPPITHTLVTYLTNLGRTGFSTDRALGQGNVAGLALRFTDHVGAPISAQPMTYRNIVYWGDWNGYEHAAVASSGKPLWRTFLGRTVGQPHHSCNPDEAGVASTATVASVNGETRVITGTGSGEVASMSAATGKIVWETRIAPKIGGFVWSSPAVYDGAVYIGVASLADCPLIPGAMVELNAATGRVVHEFKPKLPAKCSGDTMWSAPSIDPALHALFITTGNANTDSGKYCYSALADAIIELDTSTLAMRGAWSVPRKMQYLDADFGASPTLFTARIGGVTRQLVGAVDKDGEFYALRRQDLRAGPVWTARVSGPGQCPDCGQGSIASAAFDGTNLYLAGGAGKVGNKSCAGSIRSMNPATGRQHWARCLFAPELAAVSAVGGVIFVPFGPELWALNSRSGQTLFKFFDSTKGAGFDGPVTIAGSSIFVGGMDGALRRFSA